MDYIDYNDVIEFYNLMTDHLYVVDLPTIFKEKAFCEYEDSDFFDDLMIINNLYKEDIFSSSITNKNTKKVEITYNDDEDEIDSEFDTNIDDCNVSIDDNEQNNDDSKDINIIDVTPSQKISMFKENFNRYMDIVLECKNIDENKNAYAYELIILGMTDWFDFIIDILDTINTIAVEEKKCLRNKLSDFI